MTIEIKKSIKPVNYLDAIKTLEERVDKLNKNEANELIWILEHPSTFTAGTSYKESEILDKSINIVKSSRGGKITWHGPGQLICYLVINLNKRKKDIRNLVTQIENIIISFLKLYKIRSYSDRKNIGIWVKNKKIAAIGIRVSNWIAYHGFSINIKNNLSGYKKIVPCGLNNENITSIKKEKKITIKNIDFNLIKSFRKYLKKI